MAENNNIKQASRLTGALLARKGSAAPSQASLLLNQQVVNRFSSAQPDGKEHSPGNMPPSNKNITINKNGKMTDKFPVSVNEGRVSKKISNSPKSLKDPAASKRIAMTLRMEEENHLKLRIFSAYSRKSCQVILSEALDLYLQEYEDIILSGEFASQKTVENGV